jgi:D-glycero-D-manno-heptose 1,7-bisphosphate phosphatase
MKKLLILDKDGTLVKPASGGKWVLHPRDQEFLPGVENAIAHYLSEGYALAIATNQGGVSAGHKTLQSAIDETFFVMKLLRIEVGVLAHSYEAEGGEAYLIDARRGRKFEGFIYSQRKRFRKPGGGMLSHLIEMLGSDADSTLMVGDRSEDNYAAIAANVKFLDADGWRQPFILHKFL